MQHYINDGLCNPWPYKAETCPSVVYDRTSSTDSGAVGYVKGHGTRFFCALKAIFPPEVC